MAECCRPNPIYDHRRLYPPFKLDALVRFLAGNGVSASDLLHSTGLTTDDLANIETRVSFRDLVTIWQNVQRHNPDPTMAIRAGQSIHISIYGLYGYVLLCAGSLRKGIESAIRYHELVMPTTTMKLAVFGDAAYFTLEDCLGIEDLSRFNLELQVSLVYSLLLDTIGSEFRLNAIHFAFPETEYWQQTEDIFGCPVFYSQAKTCIEFPAQLLDRPMPQQNPIAEELVRARCDELIDEHRMQEGFLPKLYALLKQQIRHLPTSEQTAREFAMTSRTLRRKLTAYGTSFQQVTDQVRKEQALVLLMDTELSVDVIAERTGFSDAANFRRAFKRWTNQTPSGFRASLDPETP